jgi:hypothetical protein
VKIFIVPLGVFLVKLYRQGWEEMWRRVRENVQDSAIATAGIWTILILFNVLYTLPHDINLQAQQVRLPNLVIPSPPPSAFIKTEKNDVVRTVKVNPLIEIAPVYGNLKQRCINLSGEIAQLVQHRTDQINNGQMYPRPLTEERYLTWLKSNDTEFRHNYVPDAEAMRDELSALHIKDERLDQILDEDLDNRRLLQSRPQLSENNFGLMGVYDFQVIGERLGVLCNQLP